MQPSASNGPKPGSRRGWLDGLLLLLVLGLALGLRLHEVAVRPMHADEANQAVKLGRMLDGEGYRFDPRDHHGPTLYYLALLPAKLHGETTFASLTERTVRLTPVLAGVAAVALLWVLARPLGGEVAFLAALFLAISPAALYYSRYFIQETLLVTFTLGAFASGRLWWHRGGWGWILLTGICFGLMLATKASALVFAAAALPALLLSGTERRIVWREAAAGLVVAVVVAAAFYSSFGGNPGGLRDALTSPWTMLGRVAGGAPGHDKPVWYYAGLFLWQRTGGYLWDQTLFVLPALIGWWLAWRCRGLPRFVAVHSLLVALILSFTPYKTPWQVVNLLPGLGLLAALAIIRLQGRLAVFAGAVVVLALGWQARQAVFLRPADERNPFAYVHTVPDMLKVPALAARAPVGAVKVIAHEYWPLPWYLRSRPETGYWTELPADCDGALVFAGAEQTDAVRARLKGTYQESVLGLRPGVLVTVFMRTSE